MTETNTTLTTQPNMANRPYNSITPPTVPMVTQKRDLLTPRRFEDWRLGIPFDVTIPTNEVPYIIAVGGGKGGVGKTMVSANLAAKLAQAGNQVLVVDFDIGGANLHTYFGLGMPKRTLSDLLHPRYEDNGTLFQEIALPTSFKGVRVIPGSREDAWHIYSNWTGDLFHHVWQGILLARKNLGVNCVILDLGAGIHQHTIDFFAAAHSGVIVVLPEPTSIENAYMFLKAVLWHLVSNSARQLMMPDEQINAIKELLTSEKMASVLGQGGYLGRLRLLAKRYPLLANKIFRMLQGREIGLVLNQARCQKDIDVGKSMEHICKNYFGFLTRYLGFFNYDDVAWKSLKNQKLLVADFPHSLLAKRISDVAMKICNTRI